MAFLWGVGWQKFFSPKFVSLAQYRRTLQNPKQVSVRVKFVLLCRFNQAVDHRAGLSACRSVGKKPVLPAHHKRLYAALSTVVAQFQSAVFQITYQIRPLLQQVIQCFPESRFRRRFGDRLICPCRQSVQNRFLLFPVLTAAMCTMQSGPMEWKISWVTT